MNNPEQREGSGQNVGASAQEQADSPNLTTNHPAPAVDPTFSDDYAWFCGELVDHAAKVVELDRLAEAAGHSEISEDLGELLGFFNSANQPAALERESIERTAHTNLQQSLSSFRAAVQELPAMHLYADKGGFGTGSGASVPDLAPGRGPTTISELAGQLVADVLSVTLNESDAGPLSLRTGNGTGIWQVEPLVRDTTSVTRHDDGLSVSSLGRLGTIPVNPYGTAVSGAAAASGEIGSVVDGPAQLSPAAPIGHGENVDVICSAVDALAPIAASEAALPALPEGPATPPIQHARDDVPDLPVPAPADVTMPDSESNVAETASDPEVERNSDAPATDDDRDARDNVEPSSTEVVYPSAETTSIDYGEAGNGPPADLVPVALEFLKASPPVDLVVFATMAPAPGEEDTAPTSVEGDHRDSIPHELAEEPAPSSFDNAHDPHGHDHELHDQSPAPMEDHPLPGFDHS
jgi:hypothetical protein